MMDLPFSTTVAALASGAAVIRCPAGLAGLVGPKPVPHKTIVSPGWAGRAPGIVAGSPISVPSAAVAAGRKPYCADFPNSNREGVAGPTNTDPYDVPCAVVTLMLT